MHVRRPLPVWLRLVTLAAALLAACGPVTSPQPTPTPEPGLVLTGQDDTPRLRALLARILEPRSAQYGPTLSQPPVLRVGALPPNLPLTLPLPPGADLIGSLDEPAALWGAQVFVDTPQTAREVIDFYTEALTAQGYRVWQPGGPAVFAGLNLGLSFCAADGSVQLGVDAVQGASGPTKVSLSLLTDPRVVSCDSGLPNEQEARTQRALPTLEAPVEVVTAGSGSSYSIAGQAEVYTELRTSLTPEALLAHYAASLEAQGWQRVAQSATGPVAWSEWTHQDAEGFRWNAVLVVTAGPGGSDRRRAEFRMEMQMG